MAVSNVLPKVKAAASSERFLGSLIENYIRIDFQKNIFFPSGSLYPINVGSH